MTIRNAQGKQAVLRIGNATPVDSGYYVRLDEQAPVVVEKTTIDGTLDLLQSTLPTATPAPTQPAEATMNPQQSSETPAP
ncbi:MAG: hypothetical protein EHM21_15880 [Chloroflexi bacterium]|nr:MAG: hypothetical protein EHM21_15880 [Chloroflexota bacterium]